MNNIIEREPVEQVQLPVNPATRLIEMALTSNADIDKLERLMAMQTQWEEKNAKREFLDALARFQSKCPDIKKMKKGHNYMYAPLSDIIAQTRELLSDCGLSYRFEQDHSNGLIKVTCILSHVSGHSETNTMVSVPDTSGSKNAIQAIGSAVQYMMRYTFIGATGITTADEDMDGRLPPPEQKDVLDPIESINKSLAKQGRTAEKFFDWASKTLKREVLCFDDLSDEELQKFARKLEAMK